MAIDIKTRRRNADASSFLMALVVALCCMQAVCVGLAVITEYRYQEHQRAARELVERLHSLQAAPSDASNAAAQNRLFLYVNDYYDSLE